MDRKIFIKKTITGAAGLAIGSGMLKAKNVKIKDSNYNHFLKDTSLTDQIGFNHLPNKVELTMKTVLHKAQTRGYANHGWLESNHSFSFANYRNPERMNFGVLRVLNDDKVIEAQGFGTHPHDNMEIISIPLEGNLEHKDSMGNTTVIKKGDVQVMSAGTGVFHSEYNESKSDPVKFLQIWMFPNKRNVEPRYDQISLENNKLKDQLFQILSPNQNDQGVWAHQNAWFHMGNLNKGTVIDYTVKDSNNGVYAFILEGNVTINDQALETRDGFGIWDTDKLNIEAESDARILLMDVPMQLPI